MNFTTAMATLCTLCDKPAKLHRLDSRGNLYCLTLSHEGRKKRQTMADLGHMWTDDMVFTLPVKYLRPSDMSWHIGATINKGFRVNPNMISE